MKSNDKNTNIKVGNISNTSGEVNIAGGDIAHVENKAGLNSAELKELFNQLYLTIEAKADILPVDKVDLRAEIQEVQSVVTQAVMEDEKVDEKSLARRFRNIARMAPDILDVVVATLANPLAGLGVAVKKIAEKAKEVSI
jgi:hypothetical protein